MISVSFPSFEFLDLNLFRISCFGFRISNPTTPSAKQPQTSWRMNDSNGLVAPHRLVTHRRRARTRRDWGRGDRCGDRTSNRVQPGGTPARLGGDRLVLDGHHRTARLPAGRET